MVEIYPVVVENLYKSYKELHVLKGLNLRIKKGSVLALLGPNGAGKTTTVRILSTLIKPDSGNVTVNGHDVVKEADLARGSIGLTGQYTAVDEFLNGRENLEMMGRLYHLSPADARKRATELLEQFDLLEAAERKVKTYSGGMRRRLDLAASLIATPPVLILDEPTTGLDPRSRLTMWAIIKTLVDADVTILLTTQNLEEAEKLADRIAVLDHGKIIIEGTSQELKDKVGKADPTLDDVFLHFTGHGAVEEKKDEQTEKDTKLHIAPYAISSVKAQVRSRFSWLLTDLGVFIKRSLTHIFKNPDQLLGLTIQPIMFMLLFRYVFGGAIQTGISYVNFLVAGILVQSIAFGSMTTSISVAIDLQKGIIERFKSLPTVSWGVLTGHVTADMVRNLLQAIVMIGIGLLVGFRPTANVQEWLMIVGIILLFTLAMSWIGAIMGLLAKSIESVQWMGFFVVFPLTFASAAFVPTASMPKALRLFAENQPVTHVIEAIRALMVGMPVGNHVLLSVVWCVGVAIIAIPIAGYLFRRYSGGK